MRKRSFVVHKLVCIKCGQEMWVPRSRLRKRGHIKDLYCITCGETTHFRELRDEELPTMYEKEIEMSKPAGQITVSIEIENADEVKDTLNEINAALEKANSLIEELAAKKVSVTLERKEVTAGQLAEQVEEALIKSAATRDSASKER